MRVTFKQCETCDVIREYTFNNNGNVVVASISKTTLKEIPFDIWDDLCKEIGLFTRLKYFKSYTFVSDAPYVVVSSENLLYEGYVIPPMFSSLIEFLAKEWEI